MLTRHGELRRNRSLRIWCQSNIIWRFPHYAQRTVIIEMQSETGETRPDTPVPARICPRSGSVSAANGADRRVNWPENSVGARRVETRGDKNGTGFVFRSLASYHRRKKEARATEAACIIVAEFRRQRLCQAAVPAQLGLQRSPPRSRIAPFATRNRARHQRDRPKTIILGISSVSPVAALAPTPAFRPRRPQRAGGG